MNCDGSTAAIANPGHQNSNQDYEIDPAAAIEIVPLQSIKTA
jgi:hypothetical protein